MTISQKILNGIEILTMENKHLKVSIAPALGGKILSVYNNRLAKEFVWINKNLPLSINERGADFDSNFIGGIDELIPNDAPEKIDSIDYPDHGELWSTCLQYEVLDQKIRVHGKLALSGIYYNKTMYLDDGAPIVSFDYSLRNDSARQRHFLWKLHAALNITAGDQLLTAAKRAKVADAAYSRFKSIREFHWPFIENINASLVPGNDKTMDFFYLYDYAAGEMQLLNKNNEHLFSYLYDKKVFPYQWYFASYGGFLDHYTAILEPCTNMPMNVNEAMEKKQCAKLKPGEELTTTVRIFAGEKNNYIS